MIYFFQVGKNVGCHWCKTACFGGTKRGQTPHAVGQISDFRCNDEDPGIASCGVHDKVSCVYLWRKSFYFLRDDITYTPIAYPFIMKDSVGIVETQFLSPSSSLPLESGEILDNFTIAYETYGHLNDTKSNAILICHALSGDAHAAGYHPGETKKPGWWEIMIGPGKAIDTNRFFVVVSNIIGSCMGSTGPSSINPETSDPYGCLWLVH